MQHALTRLCSSIRLCPVRYSSTDAGPASVLEHDTHAGSQATSRVRLLGFFITPVALPDTAGDSSRRDLYSHVLLAPVASPGSATEINMALTATPSNVIGGSLRLEVVSNLLAPFG